MIFFRLIFSCLLIFVIPATLSNIYEDINLKELLNMSYLSFWSKTLSLLKELCGFFFVLLFQMVGTFLSVCHMQELIFTSQFTCHLKVRKWNWREFKKWKRIFFLATIYRSETDWLRYINHKKSEQASNNTTSQKCILCTSWHKI